MKIDNVIIRTKVARPGMLVREVFAECGQVRVQALPFVDKSGKITGRITLFSCLQEYMVDMAPLLGSFLSCVDNAEEKIKEVLCSPVDGYVREARVTITSDAPAIKALAIVE